MEFREKVRELLLEGLTDDQRAAVQSSARRVLIVAGAGSGKTEVMARRVAWWVGVDGVPKDSIVAFTFTERGAEEMKFRIRGWLERAKIEDDTTLGGMYVGTIHAFCLKTLRELWPDAYHNYDVIDEAGRLALVQRSYFGILGLKKLKDALGTGMYATIEKFLATYDILNEFDEFDPELPPGPMPYDVANEADWCKMAAVRNDLGTSEAATAFADSAARYYAYLRCRRFLDFSTSQSELLRMLQKAPSVLKDLRMRVTHLVVDEVQDINPVQDRIIRNIVGESGRLTAVGDHRQAIFGWRGGRVDIMARLYEELSADPDKSEVIELKENFRSTPRIIRVANLWAGTIGPLRSLSTPEMRHGNKRRRDYDSTHVAALSFDNRQAEAGWIAETISTMVRAGQPNMGAAHDTKDGERGLCYSDIAILIRSSTDARTYMQALERKAVPAVFRAGPDLFSQPEVLLFLGALARMADLKEFVGAPQDRRSLPKRIAATLGCDPVPDQVIDRACAVLRSVGLPLRHNSEKRIVLAGELIARRLRGKPPASEAELRRLHTRELREWLRRPGKLRRVFPQALYHYVLAEAEVGEWELVVPRGRTAMFHLGQLSSLITGIETPGWTSIDDFKYQVIGLLLWGAQNAAVEEAPLLVQPDAVTITTIHSAKGLEFPAVFLADVNAQRFPSGYAKTPPELPLEGAVLQRIAPEQLADNDNYDSERRLMYVALTRAERYLFVTCSGSKRSAFFRSVENLIRDAGGTTGGQASSVPRALQHLKSEHRRDLRLVTSFSDLRYYLECPHDFYLRKVLGFAPTIDQAFGYGRAVHNLLRAVHADPTVWAALAKNPAALERQLDELIGRGLFYLRYTTGEPLARMRARALQIVRDYILRYQTELARLTFEPEREFETLIEEEQVLISGAIDVIRLDDPPRVTLIDFKSGEADSDSRQKLDEDEMRLQVTVYGLAAKRELEYEPERGLVRYLGEPDGPLEIEVNLDDETLAGARKTVLEAAREIKERNFFKGPRRPSRQGQAVLRCTECDFRLFCGMPEAKRTRHS